LYFKQIEAYNNDNIELIDTVGLTDTRFDLKQKIDMIIKILKECGTGIDGIILCLKYGRTDNETRTNLKTFLNIFKFDEIKEITILVITYDDDDNGEEWFKNQVITNDEDAVFLNNFCKTKIISGSLKISKNKILDDHINEHNRKPFLIKTNNTLLENKIRVDCDFDYKDKGKLSEKIIKIIKEQNDKIENKIINHAIDELFFWKIWRNVIWYKRL